MGRDETLSELMDRARMQSLRHYERERDNAQRYVDGTHPQLFGAAPMDSSEITFWKLKIAQYEAEIEKVRKLIASAS